MSDERDKLLKMLQDGQRIVKSRTAPSTATPRYTATAIRPPREEDDKDGVDGEARQPEVASHLNATDSLKEFLAHYYREFSAFAQDSMRSELELGAELTAYDRQVLHGLAQACGFSHSSRGTGSDRRLVLLKDTLFYSHPELYAGVNVAEMGDRIAGKESKYELRWKPRSGGHGSPPPAPGQIGSYADEDAARMMDRFRRATNEYRHARHMGYSQEEAIAMEHDPNRLEAILRGDDDEKGVQQPRFLGFNTTSGSSSAAPLGITAGGAAAAAASSSASSSSPAAASSARRPVAAQGPPSVVTYDEVCKGCGARARLDCDRSKWTCLHYCGQCAKSTVWVLEEAAGLAVPARAGQKRPRDGDDAAGEGLYRRQKDEAERYGSTAPPALDGDEDEDEDDESGEALTVDDVVDNASINDFSDTDTNWLRAFALRNAASLRQHVIFCIEFADLMRASIFRRHDANAAATSDAAESEAPALQRRREELPPCLYVVVREVGAKTADAAPVAVTALVDRVAEAAWGGSKEKEVEGRLGIAFRNLSVYGVEATALCQLRNAGDAEAAALAPLQKEYGSRHIFVTKTLSEAIVQATAE